MRPFDLNSRHIVIAITGASGVIYGVRFVKWLNNHLIKNGGKIDGQTVTTHLIISENGSLILGHEMGMSVEELGAFVDHTYRNDNEAAVLASGSFRFEAFIICPCSMSTLSKIATGVSDNLTTRVAAVSLKEGRRMIMIPREAPLSTIHIDNMAALSHMGVTILPAMPAFYHQPETVSDLVDFMTGKLADQLGIRHDLYAHWEP